MAAIPFLQPPEDSDGNKRRQPETEEESDLRRGDDAEEGQEEARPRKKVRARR